MPDLDTLLWRYVVGAILPLWLLAGLGDWWCHRRTQIERTSGLHESVLHVLMLAEVGLPVLLVLFLKVNALVLALGAGAVVLHALTSWRDLAWSAERRHIAPVEQALHSVLEMAPLVALSLLALLHRDALRAADFALRWDPAPAAVVAAVLAGALVLAVLPFAEELWRCLRSSTSTAPPNAP